VNSEQGRIVGILRTSAVPYLAVLVCGALTSRYVEYVWPQRVILKGQPASIVILAALFVVAAILWFLYEGTRTRSRVLTWFIVVMSAAWAVHMMILIGNSDNFNHLAWLYVPTLLMLLFKTPTSKDAWQGLIVLGWFVVVGIVLTRVLEIVGVLQPYYIAAWINDFDKANYWLPFSGYLGVEGKWTGPFGASAHTSMMAMFLVVLGICRWTKSSVVFLIVGVVTLLLTSGRTSYLAIVASGLILLLFSRAGVLERVPMRIRLIALAIGVVALAGVLWKIGPGLTGREAIWPAFLDVWRTSIWHGVGAPGIEAAGGMAAQTDEAHNMFIDELTRYGLIGMAALLASLGVGVAATVKSAIRGFAGPLALLVAYFIAAMTDVRNDWIQPSPTGLLVILAVVSAAQWSVELDASAERQAVSAPGTAV
jgi:O-antigen ligase